VTEVQDMARLQWQCRRGMLELDYILREFLDTRYPHLGEAMQRDFVRLLGCPDPLLLDWLMGHSAPGEPALQRMVSLLRSRQG
jgi:antitoxin CptB